MRKKKALLNLRIKPNGNTIYGQEKNGSTSGVVVQGISTTV